MARGKPVPHLVWAFRLRKVYVLGRDGQGRRAWTLVRAEAQVFPSAAAARREEREIRRARGTRRREQGIAGIEPAPERAIVCETPGCPAHEIPKDDCADCAMEFWSRINVKGGDRDGAIRRQEGGPQRPEEAQRQ